MTTSSQTLRQTIREKRDAISEQDRSAAEMLATKRLTNSPLFLRSQHIACYFPTGSEMPTYELMKRIWKAGKYCYLPVASRMRPGYMEFARYEPGDELIANNFGILEPAITAKRMPVWALQLVIVPLIAFDKQGNRVGSGCGFYDRVFADIKNWAHSPTLCGFAFRVQEVDKMNPESWDVPMDFVVTE